MENNTKNKKTRTDANRRADRKYNKKKKTFAIVYTPTDIKEANRLENYLKTIDISVNSCLKNIIKEYLDSKNVPYDNNEN